MSTPTQKIQSLPLTMFYTNIAARLEAIEAMATLPPDTKWTEVLASFDAAYRTAVKAQRT